MHALFLSFSLQIYQVNVLKQHKFDQKSHFAKNELFSKKFVEVKIKTLTPLFLFFKMTSNKFSCIYMSGEYLSYKYQQLQKICG